MELNPQKLIELPTARLLEKFGSGNHKPGSGSAAALQGLLAGELAKTVIALTLKKPQYSKLEPELAQHIAAIEEHILPQLAKLFDEDSVLFGKVIELRTRRDEAKGDSTKWHRLANEVLESTVPATEILIKIARLCVQLSDFSTFIFQHGFRSARGDSSVALNGANAAISGCLSIIQLNLLSFEKNEWTDRIRLEAHAIHERLAELHSNAQELDSNLRFESERHDQFCSAMLGIKQLKRATPDYRSEEIEDIAKTLQNTLWAFRDRIWPMREWSSSDPSLELGVLSPQRALEKLGFCVYMNSPIEPYWNGEQRIPIAGIIDNNLKEVRISSDFSKQTKLFTTAHELGHAVLHNDLVMHRDRPLDGIGRDRNPIEQQADLFAAFFLMPSKRVIELFQSFFGLGQFMINEATALGLGLRKVDELRAHCRSRRELARVVASTPDFAGKKFLPINDVFKVSVETMAIRLEELKLVRFD